MNDASIHLSRLASQAKYESYLLHSEDADSLQAGFDAGYASAFLRALEVGVHLGRLASEGNGGDVGTNVKRRLVEIVDRANKRGDRAKKLEVAKDDERGEGDSDGDGEDNNDGDDDGDGDWLNDNGGGDEGGDYDRGAMSAPLYDADDDDDEEERDLTAELYDAVMEMMDPAKEVKRDKTACL